MSISNVSSSYSKMITLTECSQNEKERLLQKFNFLHYRVKDNKMKDNNNSKKILSVNEKNIQSFSVLTSVNLDNLNYYNMNCSNSINNLNLSKGNVNQSNQTINPIFQKSFNEIKCSYIENKIKKENSNNTKVIKKNSNSSISSLKNKNSKNKLSNNKIIENINENSKTVSGQTEKESTYHIITIDKNISFDAPQKIEVPLHKNHEIKSFHSSKIELKGQDDINTNEKPSENEHCNSLFAKNKSIEMLSNDKDNMQLIESDSGNNKVIPNNVNLKINLDIGNNNDLNTSKSNSEYSLCDKEKNQVAKKPLIDSKEQINKLNYSIEATSEDNSISNNGNNFNNININANPKRKYDNYSSESSQIDSYNSAVHVPITLLNDRNKQNKMVKLFLSNNSSYEVSSRYINDELLINTNNTVNNYSNYDNNYKTSNASFISSNSTNFGINKHHDNYFFISKIKEKTNMITNINYSQFKKLSPKSVFNILTFCFDEFKLFENPMNKALLLKFRWSLYKMFDESIKQFTCKYKNLLKITKVTFVQNMFTIHKKNYPVFDLCIKAQIISKEINKCYSIENSFMLSNGKQLNQTYKFDVNSLNDVTWIYNELDNKEYYSYVQPIYPYKTNDEIELYIHLFTMNGIIVPSSLKWDDYTVSEAPREFFEKKKVRSGCPFDPSRACEIENNILFWRNEELVENKQIINQIKRIFGVCFKIEGIQFYQYKLFTYKIKLLAVNVGILEKNIFFDYDIEVVDGDKSICKELHDLYTLNSLMYNNRLKVRVGMRLIVYLSHYK